MLSHVWFCNPMDCSPPGSSVHGIHTFLPPLLLASSFLSLPPPCLYLHCLTLDHSWAGLIKCDFPLQYFLEWFDKIYINSSLNVSPMKPSDPGHLFVESCLIIDLIFLIVFSLFRFSISSNSVLKECVFLGIYPFIPGCPVCLHNGS